MTDIEPPVRMSIGPRLYRAIVRHLPVNSGLTALTFNPVANWLFSRSPDSALFITSAGIPIVVDPNDYDGRMLWLFGTNDRKVLDIVTTLLSRNDVFLDIGANYGTIGLAAARIVGPEGRVHLVEPQSGLCEVMRFAVETEVDPIHGTT